MKTADPSTTSPAFKDEVREVVQRLRGALSDVCFSLPGGSPERASQLASALDLDEGLAWKLMKVINVGDPFEATRYVPGPSGAKIFLRAARQKKIGEEVVARLESALSSYRRLIKELAGDRKSFDMMAAGQIERDPLRADIVHRKGAFQHLSYLYGIQARTELRTYFLRPSADAPTYDLVSIHGYVSLRRIRESVPWRVSSVFTIDDVGTVQTQFACEPLDPEGASDPGSAGLPLLRQFSSLPMPVFRRVPRARGFHDYVLSDDRLGDAGQFTFFTGEIVRSAEPRFRDAHHQMLGVEVGARTPCERLIVDLFMHRDMFERFAPATDLYSDVFMHDPTEMFQTWDRMPTHETAVPLGRGMSAVFAREVPRYRELVAFAFARAGWKSDEFDVYRLTVAYPLVRTTMRISQTLPERPVNP